MTDSPTDAHAWSVFVTSGPPNGVVPLPHGWILPAQFTVTATGGPHNYEVRLEVEVIDGVAECRSLYIARPRGTSPIRNAALRVPVDTLVQQGAKAMLMKTQRQANGAIRASPAGGQQQAATVPTPGRRRRRPTTPEVLEEVARVWIEELELDPRRPAKNAAARLFMSVSNFARLKQEAIGAGLIGSQYQNRATNSRKKEHL